MLSFESFISFFGKSIMGFYYAVAKGRNPGIYHTWDECKRQVHQFPGPVFKKFSSSREAQEFIDSRTSSSSSQPSYSNASGNSKSYRGSSKRLRDSEERDENAFRAKKRWQPSTSGKSSSKSYESNDKKDFNMDPDGYVNVYTDGACSGNGYSGAKAGVGVYFGEDSPLNVSAPVVGRATNNMAEIQAVTRAAEIARKAGMTKLRVHTDSEFLIKSATLWMPGWKKRGWITASGGAVANKVELQEMESALKSLKVEWNHVRGHQGIHGNEMADKLARQGAEKYRKQ